MHEYTTVTEVKVEDMKIITKFHGFPLTSRYKSGIYFGFAAMMTGNCNSAGVILNKEEGMGRSEYNNVCYKRRSNHLNILIDRWYSKFLQAVYCRSKSSLAQCAFVKARVFTKVIKSVLSKNICVKNQTYRYIIMSL